KIFLPPLFMMIGVFFNQRKVKLSGEFILFKREVYDSISGHEAIRSTVSDDLDFAALLERANFKTDFPYAEDFASTRMYSLFSTIYEGISKMFQRLLSENIFVAAWRCKKYFLLAALALISVFLFLENYHPNFFPKDLLLLLPAMIILTFIGI